LDRSSQWKDAENFGDSHRNFEEEYLKNWEDNLRILESISNSFDKSSVHYKAIEEAAQALTFLHLHKDLQMAFDRFRMLGNAELTESQIQHLRDMGIES